jgi:protease-4
MWAFSLVAMALAFGLGFYAAGEGLFGSKGSSNEAYHSGDKKSKDKIAIITVSGTIMPPFTQRVLDDIKAAKDDEKVKGVLLVVNSPGGFVADSHQIYHRLVELRSRKPIYVQMQNMAASGGLYVSMGAGESGKIFAEPTTWTGSIGVIIPHYEVHELGEKLGVKASPLTTGPMKDALSPFRPVTDAERAVWNNIMNQSFEQFLAIIDENRGGLNLDEVRSLATGQIYTAKDALGHKLVDAIGYEDDAIKALQESLGLPSAKIIKYEHATTVLDLLLSQSKAASNPRDPWSAALDLSVPRAMYLFSRLPGLPPVTPSP